MRKRKIVKIDEEKCNGCGFCIPACVEGALQIIDGKARLVSDRYCDGLGACLGECPQGAITIEEREAEEFDEEAAKAHLPKIESPIVLTQSRGIAWSSHPHSPVSCPSAAPRYIDRPQRKDDKTGISSMLSQWPVKIALVSPQAPYFNGADLLIAADCVPFAYGNFHPDFLKDKMVVIGCPKLDNIQFYENKLRQILQQSSIKSITVVHMEVPCCFGLYGAVEEAVRDSKKDIFPKQVIIGIDGKLK